VTLSMDENNIFAAMAMFWGTIYGMILLTSTCKAMVIPFWVSKFSRETKRD
jgi:hypothetical protein